MKMDKFIRVINLLESQVSEFEACSTHLFAIKWNKTYGGHLLTEVSECG
jgi:hypothetical protein